MEEHLEKECPVMEIKCPFVIVGCAFEVMTMLCRERCANPHSYEFFSTAVDAKRSVQALTIQLLNAVHE